MIEDLFDDQDRRVIFFWDELPLMIYNIKQRSGEEAAMELLDTLRSLRQMHSDLRMVFTGSIGLHNVITWLRRAGYANDPTNDMHSFDVPPLLSDDAGELARRLLEGERIQTDDEATIARAIASAVDCIPHYVHHIVDQMAQRGIKASAENVDRIVSDSFTDSQDPWHMRYYRERIDTYYAPDECRFALNLLDILSSVDQPLLFDELFNLLKSRLVTEEDEAARQVLDLLQRDHYIARQSNGAFCFRSELIRRWWRWHRGI